MLAARRIVPALIGLCFAASSAQSQPRRLSKPDDYLAPAEVLAAVTIQESADVNQRRTFPDFGVAVGAVGYLTASLGVVGEAGAYRNEQADHVRARLRAARFHLRACRRSGGQVGEAGTPPRACC